MSSKIVIVDYGMGNIHAVYRKFSLLGLTATVSNDREMLDSADKIILPGVGHFGEAMENLKSLGLQEVLNKKVLIDKTPILGICLGMQLMANGSEEGNSIGLGWIDAEVQKFKITNSIDYKVPHVGWNQVEIMKESRLMEGIENLSEFYFVHSFMCKCNDDKDILNTTNYELKFVSAFQKENIYGVQYHPEKSFEVGRILISNFAKL